MTVGDRGDPTPNNFYDYSFGELFIFYRKAIDPEMQDLLKELRDRHVIS